MRQNFNQGWQKKVLGVERGGGLRWVGGLPQLCPLFLYNSLRWTLTIQSRIFQKVKVNVSQFNISNNSTQSINRRYRGNQNEIPIEKWQLEKHPLLVSFVRMSGKVKVTHYFNFHSAQCCSVILSVALNCYYIIQCKSHNGLRHPGLFPKRWTKLVWISW